MNTLKINALVLTANRMIVDYREDPNNQLIVLIRYTLEVIQNGLFDVLARTMAYHILNEENIPNDMIDPSEHLNIDYLTLLEELLTNDIQDKIGMSINFMKL